MSTRKVTIKELKQIIKEIIREVSYDDLEMGDKDKYNKRNTSIAQNKVKPIKFKPAHYTFRDKKEISITPKVVITPTSLRYDISRPDDRHTIFNLTVNSEKVFFYFQEYISYETPSKDILLSLSDFLNYAKDYVTTLDDNLIRKIDNKVREVLRKGEYVNDHFNI